MDERRPPTVLMMTNNFIVTWNRFPWQTIDDQIGNDSKMQEKRKKEIQLQCKQIFFFFYNSGVQVFGRFCPIDTVNQDKSKVCDGVNE